MNSYTDKSTFTEDAQYILENSELLVKCDCLIVDGVLYEWLDDPDEFDGHNYRFFFNTDDYDYLEHGEFEKKLDELFAQTTPAQRHEQNNRKE